ncbi:MAG: hypothetical protein FD153_930 [Rhodospirillaceae bacterium]|nr:MAG: hypothetical protein FD153_930 [Rhodospirillaceae bacterium]
MERAPFPRPTADLWTRLKEHGAEIRDAAGNPVTDQTAVFVILESKVGASGALPGQSSFRSVGGYVQEPSPDPRGRVGVGVIGTSGVGGWWGLVPVTLRCELK